MKRKRGMTDEEEEEEIHSIWMTITLGALAG